MLKKTLFQFPSPRSLPAGIANLMSTRQFVGTPDVVAFLGLERAGRTDLPAECGRAALFLCGTKQSLTLILYFAPWFVTAH